MTSLLTSTSDSVLTVLVPLLDEAPEAKDVHTGWWYLVVIVSLIIAMILLWRSMKKQMNRIQFEEKAAAPREPQPPATGQDS